MTLENPTLPTIHLNGTGAETLQREYREAALAASKAMDALLNATCNQRDFYTQDPSAWRQALAERAEALEMLRKVQAFVDGWRWHAHRSLRR